jgi:uncharacterized protein YndB with AHSA1/START domain
MNEEQRVIDLSVEVPGTPEEVWAAIATGPGITSWFIPHEIEEREGGTVTMDFGTFGKETALVSAWEPPHRVVFQGGGDRPLAYEWLVEARDGGTCVVRLVNSGFGTGADWDADYDGMTSGWTLFLQNLKLHLTHFRGQHARAAVPVGVAPGKNEAGFAALCASLGVSPDLQPGDRFETSGDGVPVLRGTVEQASRKPSASHYLLLLSDPVPGTAFLAAEGAGDGVMVSLYQYLYGEQAPADEWTPFFAERFPLPQPEPQPASA